MRNRLETNNDDFGNWVMEYRETLAVMYFEFFEFTMDKLEGSTKDIPALDEFVMGMYDHAREDVEEKGRGKKLLTLN